MADTPKSQAQLLEEISNLFEQFAHLEKVKSEERQSLQFYEELVEHSVTPIILLHADCTIKFATPSAEEIFGYSRDELHGNSIFDYIHPEDIAKGETQLSRVVDNPEQALPCLKVRIHREDGEERKIEGIGRNYLAENSIKGIFVNLRDITDEQQFDNQMLHAQKMEALGHIAGGIAHDFRNILAIIMGATQMLELKPSEDQVRQYLNMIMSSVKRGTTITERVLAFARAKEPDFQKLSGLTYLENIREIAFHTLPKNVRTTVEPYRGDDEIFADPGQLQQVLLNLCINAANAMPDGGEIALGVEEPDPEMVQRYKPDTETDYLCITVSDTGVGMDEEMLEHVFEPFFTTRDEGDGTGLGLSVVYRTMQLHDGWIDIESEKGKGTKVTLGLPRAHDEVTPEPEPVKPPVEEETESPEKTADSTPHHLLVVEDEAYIRDLLAEVLEAQGYNVSTVANGEDAFLRYEDDPDGIDLIITDLNMPVMDGKELERNVHLIDPGKKMIAITGSIGLEEHDDLAEHDFLTVVMKPFDIQKVLKTIKNVLSEE